MGTMTEQSQQSTYDALGGSATFHRLVSGFYARVAHDPVLRPLYPEPDLAPAAERLQMFLEQYWGGPRTYSEQRGHPRLRMRHVRFKVDEAARDAWLGHMRASLDELALPAEQDALLWEYLVMAANSLVNTLNNNAGNTTVEPPAGPAFTLQVSDAQKGRA